ncbi:hypothetical protein TIFTF001_029218 [Ficus carica]|uniref:Legume-specific protein n=1 Tax=Ficus carica TaxID=3494 RepID=A0AA88DRS5_FICCA|nr:hypothetical protein TIFTF001_029218 [Ficus carica]
MEGLIPFVYRVIVEYKNGNKHQHDLLGSWFSESPSASYIRLPTGESGRFGQASDFSVFKQDLVYTSQSSSLPPNSSAVNSNPSSTSQNMVSSGVHSPIRRRVAA